MRTIQSNPVVTLNLKQTKKQAEYDIDKYLATDAGDDNFEKLVNDPQFLGVPEE